MSEKARESACTDAAHLAQEAGRHALGVPAGHDALPVRGRGAGRKQRGERAQRLVPLRRGAAGGAAGAGRLGVEGLRR
jgi:hypothetical protein